MKHLLCITFLAGVSGLASAAPVVSDVAVGFDSDTRMMKVSYTLAGEPAIVTVDILKDGQSIGAAKFADVAGDVNGLVQPGARTISWRPERLWPEQKVDTPSFTAKVSAWSLDAPPPYLVVWLTEEKGKVRHYASADALPGGLTNDVYRTKRLVMARCPAKDRTWRMGSLATETGRQPAETPHWVTFTEDYYAGVFPVTQGQARLFGGTVVAGRGDDFPAVQNSYNAIRGTKGGNPDIDWPRTGSAVAPTSILGRLRATTGLAFDIPTEAQFEYAARAGSPTAYPNNLECLTAADAADANLAQLGWYKHGNGAPHAVGLKAPNAWGLYDVCGTIWEWCRDWVGTGAVVPYAADDATDPTGLETGTWRSRRGGNFDNVPYAARCAFRTANAPDTSNGGISFRLVLPQSEITGR